MDFPNLCNFNTSGHQDYVTTPDGKVIGYASAGHYSYYYREIISETVIDIDQAEIGNEVIVQGGDAGKRIKNIRARVERYPYLDLPDNKDNTAVRIRKTRVRQSFRYDIFEKNNGRRYKKGEKWIFSSDSGRLKTPA